MPACRAGASWTAPLLQVRASLLGYWRVFKLMLFNVRQKMDLLFLHLPQDQVAQLKRLAAGAGGGRRQAVGCGCCGVGCQQRILIGDTYAANVLRFPWH